METIRINCRSKINQLNDLQELLYEFRNKFGKYKRMNETEEKVFKQLYELYDKEEKSVIDAEKEVEEFFKNKLGKYWRMKVTVLSYNHEYVEEYVIYPYEFIKSNQYFFAIKSNDIHENISHLCEVKDTSFSVDWFFRGDTTIEMEEITKEEFIEKSTKGLVGILDYRLMRLEQKKEEEGCTFTQLSNI